MTWKLFIGVIGAVISGQVQAICVIDTQSDKGGSLPSTMTTQALIIRIDADAPADTSKFIPGAEANTPPQGTRVTFTGCEIGNPYGKAVASLLGPSIGGGLFATNIDGIAIKPLWNNGGNPAYGLYPSSAGMTFSTDIGRWTYGENSYFRIELYKIKDTLDLKNPNGDVVLPSGTAAYNWVNDASLANYAQRLDTGVITIISTPACTFDGTKIIDFGLVTSSRLQSGIERPLNFDITCKTDYGQYSAKAAITTQTPSDDGSYIKVRDNNGQLDRMQIKISDSNGRQLPLNGAVSEQKLNIASGIPAEFNWTATLEPVSSAVKPANGSFSAAAEIILQIN